MSILLLESVPTSDPIVILLQWGVLGVVLVMLITGWLWAKPAVEQMQKRQDEERKLFRDEIIPKIDKNNQLLEELVRLMRAKS